MSLATEEGSDEQEDSRVLHELLQSTLTNVQNLSAQLDELKKQVRTQSRFDLSHIIRQILYY